MITIQALEPTQFIRQVFGTATGQVFFELDIEFSLRLTKALEELTDENKISQQAALTSSLPYGRRNKILLQEYEVNILDENIPPVRVRVEKDGTLIDVSRMRVLGLTDRSKRIEVELYGGGWIDDLEECSIADLDLGTYSYTLANVLASWADTSALAVPAPADYGFWHTPGDMTRKDLRFKFNLWELARLAFCEIGWTLRSPFYEGDIGGQFYGYLSPEDWYDYSTKDSDFTVITNIPTPEAKTGAVQWIEFSELQDIQNQYGVFGIANPRAQFRYLGSGDPQVRLRIIVEHIVVILPPNLAPGTFKIEVIKERGSEGFPGGVIQTVLWEFSRLGSNSQTIEENISIDIVDEDCDFNQLDIYFIRMRYQWTNPLGVIFDLPYTLNSGIVRYIPQVRRYVEDNDIPLAELLDESISCDLLFEALVHLCRGLVTTDESSKVVTLYTPFDINFNGNTYEGYFKRSQPPVDLTDQVIVDSRDVKFKQSTQDRFVLLRFANPTDAVILDRGPEHPHSRTVDLGRGKNKTTELDNPLFEPSIPVFVPGSEIGGTGLFLDAHVDNLDGNLSNKIGPRIGFHFGLVEMEEDNLGTPYDFVFEGVSRSSFGYIAQSVPANVGNIAPFFEIVFSERGNDLYNLAYRRWLLEQFSNADIEFLVWLSFQDYLEFNFRSPVAINYNEAFILYQATAIKDFHVEKDISTPITFKKINC